MKTPSTNPIFRSVRNGLTASVTLLSVVALTACSDEDLGVYMDASDSRSVWEVATPGGLVQQADGTWKANNCRVPLTGPGRIVNDINQQVGVVSGASASMEQIVDTDLTNQHNVPAVVDASLVYTPIVSIKDMHRVYSAGQKVGFVYKDESGQGIKLLSLKLLNSLSLTTYLRGVKQETSIQNEGGNALSLDLLSLNSDSQVANRVIAFQTTKPFDEVAFGVQGVEANAAATISLAIKYAFVGENPEIRATAEPQFASFWDGGIPAVIKDNVAGGSNITDEDITNSAPFTSELGISSFARIDLKKQFTTGTEIGFCYSVGKLIDLGLLGTDTPELTTYDSSGKKLESSEPSKDLLSLGLIGGTSGKTFTNIEIKKPCSHIQFKHPTKLLDLGGMSVYYAYVREGVRLDPANEFSFGSDTTYHVSYRLPSPSAGGHVAYQVINMPYGSNPSISQIGGKPVLDGMTHDGAYRIQALYTSSDGRQVSHIATIYHKSENRLKGNRYITARSHGAYATEPIGWSGSLLSLFTGKNSLNNVVDNTLSSYATAYKLATVLNWTPVAAFELNKPVEGNGKEIRTGFVVQAQNHLLDLTALSIFKIKLYRNGILVHESGVSDKSTVKLGLIGTDNGKVRLSVETDQSYDRIELWEKGAAGLLNNLRLYHLFYEDSACEATSEVGGGFELMTNVKDGLTIDYAHTDLQGLLSVGGKISDLTHLLDGSIATGVKLQSTLSIGDAKFSLAFPEKAANQPVGLILGEVPNLLNLKLADIGILNVYHDNEKVASTKDFNLLGADLISRNGRTYLEVTPTQPFNRIEFIVGGVDLLGKTQVNGVYLRPDPDGDGIPGTGDGMPNDKLSIAPGTYRTCHGNALRIPYTQATGNMDAGTVVSLYCESLKNETDYQRVEATLDGQSIVIPPHALPVGQYRVTVWAMDGQQLIESKDILAYIHPLMTTWKRKAVDTDWNNWDNWTEGAPWDCTNVIVPSHADRYPVLAGTGENRCDNVHIEPGAEIVGTWHLQGTGMNFVDVSVQGGRNYLLAAPLKGTFTGDMFINPNIQWSERYYFTCLDADNYPESRTSPVVYQRFWSRTAVEKIVGPNGTLEDTDVSTAEWSQEFNNVGQEYENFQGFSFQAGKAGDFQGYTLRFPKVHPQYSYFTPEGIPTGQQQTIDRNTASIGQFKELPSSVTLKNKGGNTFAMGNPMMCHLDASKFLQANADVVAQIQVYDGSSYQAMLLADGTLLSSKTVPGQLIAPMEGFLLTAKGASSSLTVKLDESMFCQKAKTTARQTLPLPAAHLRIQAECNGEVACCIVRQSDAASNTYRAGEDAPLVVEDKHRPSIAVYTPCEGTALSIQQLQAADRIPLGVLVKTPGEVNILVNAQGSEWDGWSLLDAKTQTVYPLGSELRFTQVESGNHRFFLLREGQQ